MRIVVTDLTRFNKDDQLCLAGLTEDGSKCIRPLWSTKPSYLSYGTCKEHNILPGTILDGDFELSTIVAPHTEDHLIKGKLKNCGNASSDDFKKILQYSSCSSVNEGFNSKLPHGMKVIPLDMAPSKSIVTLKIKPENFRISVDKFNDEKIKAHLTDGDNNELSFLPITDLGFFDRVGRKITRNTTAAEATEFIRNQSDLYIRLGLGREYQNQDGRIGFWMQVNGIYTFPDYNNSIRTYA